MEEVNIPFPYLPHNAFSDEINALEDCIDFVNKQGYAIDYTPEFPLPIYIYILQYKILLVSCTHKRIISQSPKQKKLFNLELTSFKNC